MKFPSRRRSDGSEEGSAGQGGRGTVYLVGAGPGDPGLLTLRAARLLRTADIVIHDALVGEGILDLIRPDARRIDVGKRFGGRRTRQDRINELLIESAASARIVVRLKGGDPFIFGRGGEEALALRAAGIPFRVVPGITAAVGVSAYAGIPLTHRDFASAVTFVTGHEDIDRRTKRVEWESLARLGGTLVIYMGMAGLDAISRRLIEGGRAAGTPAAAIEWGTHARQRTVEAPLSEIAARAGEAGIGAPALVVVGEVAALRAGISWFDQLPLRGRRILVARSRAQPSRITAALRNLGAEVTEYPRLRAEPVARAPAVDRAFGEMDRYRWVLFTSPAAVAHFWREAADRGLDSRLLGGVRVASLGLATSRALGRRGISPDLATRTYDPAEVAHRISEVTPLQGERILFPADDSLPSAIVDVLGAAGARVDRIAIFRTVPEPGRGHPDDFAADVVVLPSSSSARYVAAELDLGPRTRFVAIGPRTARTALDLGLPVHAVAGEHTVGGAVRAVLEVCEPAAGAGEAQQPRAEAPPVTA